MAIKLALKTLIVLMLNGLVIDAIAANISFDSSAYGSNSEGQIVVTINYDFTDTPAFGGGFNVIYDPTVLEFVSYTRAPFFGAGGPQQVATPQGFLDSPGNYLAAGLGTSDFVVGINGAGPVGEFVFDVLGSGGDGGCGATLCLTTVDVNPMISLAGQNITDAVFANGISDANVVPVPAAVWLMLSGLGVLSGFKLKSTSS